MSAINTTNNDVVFAIGANGYSTVGVDNPAQELMPSAAVFEQYQRIFGQYSVLSASAKICRYELYYSAASSGNSAICRSSPMRSYIDVDGQVSANETDYARLLTYKLTSERDLNIHVEQPRYNDMQVKQTLPCGTGGSGNRTVYDKPAMAVARWDVPFIGTDNVAWVHMKLIVRFSARY